MSKKKEISRRTFLTKVAAGGAADTSSAVDSLHRATR